MRTFYRIVSAIFSPLLVPVYGVATALWCSPLALLGYNTIWGVTLGCFILTTLMPAAVIFILHRIGLVNDAGLNNRTDRTIPYSVASLCYIACAWYFWRINSPVWLLSIPLGGMVSIIIACIINRWWKISGHMTAMGGWLAVTLLLASGQISAIAPMTMPVVTVALLTGLVGTARLALYRHTSLQVLAGTINGLVCIWATCSICTSLQTTI